MPKKIFITGATNGIGYETVKSLARDGYHIIFNARNEAKAQALVAKCVHENTSANIDYFIADLASLNTVKEAVRQYKNKFGCPDVIIHNAGIINPKYEETVDGFEKTIAINHIAPFYINKLFLPRIKQQETEVRIITVSSRAHWRARIHWKDIELTKKYAAWKAYGQSKLANIFFTKFLAKKFQHTPHTAVCLHPGVVRTGFFDKLPAFIKLLFPFFISAEKGAETTLYLVKHPSLKALSGSYFVNKEVKKSSNYSRDFERATRLWLWTERVLEEKKFL